MIFELLNNARVTDARPRNSFQEQPMICHMTGPSFVGTEPGAFRRILYHSMQCHFPQTFSSCVALT
jgi:hypothetical protein